MTLTSWSIHDIVLVGIFTLVITVVHVANFSVGPVHLILLPTLPPSTTLHSPIPNSVSSVVFHILLQYFRRRPIGGKPLFGHIRMVLTSLCNHSKPVLSDPLVHG